MTPYLIVALVAAVASYASTPGVLHFARKLGAVDVPDDRKVHAVPTPTLGGSAIFIGMIAALIAAALLSEFKASTRPFFTFPPTELAGIAIGAAMMFALGAVDDFRPMRAPAKLATQLIAAGIVFMSGVRMEYFRFPIARVGSLSLSPDISAIITIFWIVVVVNAVNLMDGLDGLAAGITGIAAATFFAYTYQLSSQGLTTPAPTALLISAIVTGALAGFLRYNFNPAKIFMGDSGAYTIGFLVACATVLGVGRTATQNQEGAAGAFIFYLPIAIPLIVLAIPILDVFLAIVRRASKGKHPFHADRGHLHHRLYEIGHGHRQAVLIMYAWTATLSAMTLIWTFVAPFWVIPLAALAVGILVYAVFPRSKPDAP